MLKDQEFRSDLLSARSAEEIYRKIAEKDESY
jgi:mannitol/fructose-specific phosphotransferase system IIA component (Ntr-type)